MGLKYIQTYCNAHNKNDMSNKNYNWWEDSKNKKEVERISWWNHPENKEDYMLPISVSESDGVWVATCNVRFQQLFHH